MSALDNLSIRQRDRYPFVNWCNVQEDGGIRKKNKVAGGAGVGIN
jgi:hypothetical protein